MNIELNSISRRAALKMNASQTEAMEKANILMVDDRPENLYAMELVLKDLGQNILRAGSGEQALKYLLHEPVAVILLDVNMPGMDGFELAEMIRERSESRRTPIIFITGYHLPEAHVLKGYTLGAVDYIVKPFIPEILKSKVSIFVDLFKKTAQVKKQAEALQKYNEELTAEIGERQLAQAQLKFQADILSQVSDAVIALDPNHHVLYWNMGAERLYSRRMSDAVGKKLDDVLEGFWLKPDEEMAARSALAKQGYWAGESSHKKKSGQTIHTELLMTPLKSTLGVVVGQLIIARDITERKKLQGMLMHSEKLAAMGQMAAAIAHELRAPLSVILGFTDIVSLKKDAATEDHALDTIKKQTIRCSNLISNLLDFSRKDPSDAMEKFDVHEPLKSALTLIEPYAQEKSVMLRKDFSPSPIWTRGFQDMFQQVIINLAVNAIDAVSSGGTVVIGARVVDQKDGESFVRIDVSDTGPGIAPDIRERIFEPFFTTKEQGKGTGLGLWLTKEIISRMNGRIECSSAKGNGAVFSVVLPAEKTLTAAEPTAV